MSVKKLNQQNFESEILNHTGTCLVDFYADWCGPCKMVAPIVDEIAQERMDVVVGKVNVDDNWHLTARYGIENIPTLIVIKDGKETARTVGVHSKQDILGMLG